MENGFKFLRPKDFYSLGENWEDVYVEVKNIRKGDVFFECERGNNYKLKAITNARRVGDGFYVLVETSEGDQVEIFYSDYTTYPGPNLYREPRFLTKVDKELVYLIA